MSKFSLILGNKTASSWSLRGYLMLAACGVEFNEVMIALRTESTHKDIVKYAPAGQVPILIHDELTISDTMAIGEYLAEIFPNVSLWPEERKLRAKARMISAEMHSGFSALRNDMPMYCTETLATPERSPELQKDIARVQALLLEELRGEREGGFLFGSFTIADAFYAPIMSRLKTYGITPENPYEAALFKKYEEKIFNLPALKKWLSEAEQEVSIRVKS